LFELMDREGDWEGLDERAMDAGCLEVLVHRILDGARPHLLAELALEDPVGLEDATSGTLVGVTTRYAARPDR
jgi:hypothetical protein